MARLLIYRGGGAGPVTTNADEAEVTFHEGKSPGQLMEERSKRIASELSRDWIISVLTRDEHMKDRDLRRLKKSKRSLAARMVEKPADRAQRLREGRGRRD
jgi:hypothetical protein